MQPWFTVYFFDIGHPCYDQLTPVKIRYLLTSIMWPYRGLKSTTYRGHVFFQSWPLTKWWFLIGSWAHVRLTCVKPGRIVWKPANASPGLKFIQIITFSSIHFFLLLLCFMFIKFKTENLIAKLQNSNQNFTFPWVSLIGFSTTWPEGATLLGWPKSIYYVLIELSHVFLPSFNVNWSNSHWDSLYLWLSWSPRSGLELLQSCPTKRINEYWI